MKSQHLLEIYIVSKPGLEWNFLYFTVVCWNVETLHFLSKRRERWPTITASIHTVLAGSGQCGKMRKGKKRQHVSNSTKLCSYSQMIWLHVENPKGSRQNLSELISRFSKVAGQIPVCRYICIYNFNQDIKFQKTIQFSILSNT